MACSTHIISDERGPRALPAAKGCFDCNRLWFRGARNYLFSFSFPPPSSSFQVGTEKHCKARGLQPPCYLCPDGLRKAVKSWWSRAPKTWTANALKFVPFLIPLLFVKTHRKGQPWWAGPFARNLLARSDSLLIHCKKDVQKDLHMIPLFLPLVEDEQSS